MGVEVWFQSNHSAMVIPLICMIQRKWILEQIPATFTWRGKEGREEEEKVEKKKRERERERERKREREREKERKTHIYTERKKSA